MPGGHSIYQEHPLRIALALALTVWPMESSAQEADGERVEVTVRGSSAGSWSSRTSTDTAAREPIDAASMLEELPSVHVRRLGGDGSFGTLSVRGSASTQVGVVLAGVPLTSAADPSIDAGSLPLWPGAVFRVHRGFAPASVGATGYLGGVLVIDPPSPAAGERTEWWALAGSFGALKLRLGDVRKVGDLSMATGLFASRSDGDFTFERTSRVTGRIEEVARRNAGHAQAGALERISLERSWGAVGATVLVDASRRGLPGTASFPARFATLEAGRLVVGADARLRSGDAGAWHAAVWGRRDTSTFDDPLGELDPTRPGAHAEDAIEAAGASIGWRGRPVDAVTADLFADGRAERFVPEASVLAAAGSRASRVAGGLGLDLEWRVASDLRLAATGRVDARRDDADGARGPGGVALGTTGGVTPSGHLGAAVRVGEAMTVAAHAGALERPPSFVELYGDRGTLLGDPSLSPERALSADVGVHGDVAVGRARYGYELVGFVTGAADLITFVPKGRGTSIARNVERAAILGAEISGAVSARRLDTRVSYTLLHSENLGDDPLVHGQPLPGRPLHDLAYDAAYRVGPVRLRYGLDLLGGITVDPEGTIELPFRALHSAGASLDVPRVRGLRAGVEIDNLFDVRTQYVSSELRPVAVAIPLSDFLGFPLPGRSVVVTLRWAPPR